MSIWREISNGAIGWNLFKQAVISLLNHFLLVALEWEGPDCLISSLSNFGLLLNFFFDRVLFALGLVLHLWIISLVWCRCSLALLERFQWLVCFYAGDAVIVLLVKDLAELGIGISFDLALDVVPLFAALAFYPPFSIVSLVLTFIEIDLLAVVAELLILECVWAQIAEPRVLVPVKLSAGPEVLGLIPGLNVCLRADRVFAHPELFGVPRHPGRQGHSSWGGIHICLFGSLVQYWLLERCPEVR